MDIIIISAIFVFTTSTFQHSLSYEIDPPKIIRTPKNQTVLEGSSVSFVCVTTGAPSPAITWRQDGKRITNGVKYNNVEIISREDWSMLRISGVQARDEAILTCEATNDSGPMASVTFQLAVLPHHRVPPGFPLIDLHPTMASVEVGKNTALACSSSGYPTPKIRWLKDYLPIELWDFKYSIVPRGDLQLMNATSSYEGKYECLAENSHGVAYSQPALLYVNDRKHKPTFDVLPANKWVQKGSSERILCSAQGSPPPVVEWRRGVTSNLKDGGAEENRVKSQGGVLMLHEVHQDETFTCVASNEMGYVSHSIVVRVKFAPEPPSAFEISDVTSSTVTLSWKSNKESDDVKKEVEYYVVEYQTTYEFAEKKTQKVFPPEKETTIRFLLPFTSYHFWIFSVNANGKSQPSKKLEVLTLEAAPSSPPTNFNARCLNSNTVLVQWRQPEQANGEITGYKVFYTLHPPKLQSEYWNVQSVDRALLTTINNLFSNRTYELKVRAVNRLGEGPNSESVTVYTAEGVMDVGIFDLANQPSNFLGEAASSTSIQLSWDPSSPTPSGGYRIRYIDSQTRNKHFLDVHPTSHLLTNLTPDTVYHITVAALSGDQEGPPSTMIQMKTQDFEAVEVNELDVESVNSSAVRVRWKAESGVKSYKVYCSEVKGEFFGNQKYHYQHFDKHHFEEYDGKRVIGKRFESKSLPSEQNSYVVGGLNASTDYLCQVATLTKNGVEKKSKTKQVKTKLPVPTAPRGLTLTLSKEDFASNGFYKVIATWQSPKQPHGKIDGYMVSFGVRGESQVEERRLQGPTFKFISPSFERGSLYVFKVAAKNAVGHGEFASKEIKIPDGVPTESPRNFTGVSSSSSSVTLTWEPPAKKHRKGLIRLYQIVYCELQQPTNDVTLNTSSLTFEIQDLIEETPYMFLIRAFTVAGPGPWSNRIIVTTDPLNALPIPKNVQLRYLSPINLEVSWSIEHKNDRFHYRPHNKKNHRHHKHYSKMVDKEVIGYQVSYSPLHSTYISDTWHHKDVPGKDVNKIVLTKLDPTSHYRVKIRIKSKSGEFGNFSKPVVSKEIEKADQARGFSVKRETAGSALLQWQPPLRIGLYKYKLQYSVESGQPFEKLEPIEKPRELTLGKSERHLMLRDLSASSRYVFSLRCLFVDGSVGAPVIFPLQPFQSPKLEAPQVSRHISEQQVVLYLQPLPMHGVLEYWLVIVPLNQTHTKLPQDFASNELLVSASLYTGSSGWAAVRIDGDKLPTEVLVGDGKKEDRELNYGKKEKNFFFNRPLPKEQSYVAFLRAFVPLHRQISSEYSKPLSLLQSSLIFFPGKSHGIDLLWVVAPICLVVVLLLFFILVLVVAKKRRLSEKNSLLNSPPKLKFLPSEFPPVDPLENYQPSVSQRHPAIPVAEFEEHVLSLSDNNNFSKEYESIDPGHQFTWHASVIEVNKSKNRYINVTAYDHSRVKLHSLVTCDVPGSDYINGNFLDGFRKQKAYIATQGPTAETVTDLWRMVWQTEAKAVVMLTKLEERGRMKCEQYWPSKGSQVYGCYVVSLIEMFELAHYVVRTFQISNDLSGERRQVKQFQFTSWPDHGVPTNPAPLLSFIRKVRSFLSHSNMTQPHQSYHFNSLQLSQMHSSAHSLPRHQHSTIRSTQHNTSPPVIVHCSAGVGRTGVYVVVDAMLDRMKVLQDVDIYGYVTCLRSQRNYMVQTEDQYIFIHEVIIEAINTGFTEIPARELHCRLHKLMDSSTGVAPITIEFQNLCKRPHKEACTSALLACNKGKNKSSNVLPFESSRVCLQPIRGVEGSDYINASFIDGYKQRKAYIASQSPLEETVDDFWRTVWESNCNIVVMLSKLKENGERHCRQYWPNDRTSRYLYFVVDPLAEYNMPQYILREFKLTDARDGQSKTVRQFQLTEWPEVGVPKTGEGFIDFIGQVHKTKEQFGHDGPILVHCSSGVGRTGVFITLSIELERMKVEGLLDVTQTVKLLRSQRMMMVDELELYVFCYKATLEYLGSFDHYTN